MPIKQPSGTTNYVIAQLQNLDIKNNKPKNKNSSTKSDATSPQKGGKPIKSAPTIFLSSISTALRGQHGGKNKKK